MMSSKMEGCVTIPSLKKKISKIFNKLQKLIHNTNDIR